MNRTELIYDGMQQDKKYPWIPPVNRYFYNLRVNWEWYSVYLHANNWDPWVCLQTSVTLEKHTTCTSFYMRHTRPSPIFMFIDWMYSKITMHFHTSVKTLHYGYRSIHLSLKFCHFHISLNRWTWQDTFTMVYSGIKISKI